MLIYGIIFENKIVLIGQTIRTLKKRIASYKSKMKDIKEKTHIINHLRAYGFDNHYWIVIEDNISSREDLNLAEKKYIKEYNTLTPNGLNLTDGGNAPIFSEQSRKKMSDSAKGRKPWNKGLRGVMKNPYKGIKRGPIHTEKHKQELSAAMSGSNNHFYGKKHSKESLEKMSASLKGRDVWNAVSGKVLKKDINGIIICIYTNKKETEEKENIDRRSLNRAIQTKKSYKGYFYEVEA
jgi:group I intron endonuclease